MGTEERGPRPSSESKMYRLAVPFLQSTQNLSFHVVVVARTAEKCTKRRAELSFFVCSLCRRRRSFVRSLITSNGDLWPGSDAELFMSRT